MTLNLYCTSELPSQATPLSISDVERQPGEGNVSRIRSLFEEKATSSSKEAVGITTTPKPPKSISPSIFKQIQKFEGATPNVKFQSINPATSIDNSPEIVRPLPTRHVPLAFSQDTPFGSTKKQLYEEALAAFISNDELPSKRSAKSAFRNILRRQESSHSNSSSGSRNAMTASQEISFHSSSLESSFSSDAESFDESSAGGSPRSVVTPSAPDHNLLPPSEDIIFLPEKWIADLNKVSKKRIKGFDSRACRYITQMAEKCKIPPLSLRIVKKEVVEFVKNEFDTFFSKANEFDFSDKKKQDAMEFVTGAMHCDNPLTKAMMPYIIIIKNALDEFLKRKRIKTEWTQNVSSLMRSLIYHHKNLGNFVFILGHIKRENMTQLLKGVMGEQFMDIIEYLEKWPEQQDDSLLDSALDKVLRCYEKVSNIQQHCFQVVEPNDPFRMLSNIDIANMLQRFIDDKDQSYKEIIINGTAVDCSNFSGIQNLWQKDYFCHLISLLYKELRCEKEPSEIKKEVVEMMLGRDTDVKELLWLCVMPWKSFYDEVRILFPGLQCDIVTIPDNKNSTIHIDIDAQGKYKVTKVIRYQVFERHRTSKGTLRLPNRKKPIAEFDFHWTVSPTKTAVGTMTWHGTIQAPEPILIFQGVSYRKKLKVLKGLVDHTDGNGIDISKLPIINDPSEEANFIEKVYSTFNNQRAWPVIETPSLFKIELAVKNFCREVLKEQIKNKNIPLPKKNKEFFKELAVSIWKSLQINGCVLESILTRLEEFDARLRRLIAVESTRTQWTDQLLAYLKELILSRKYAGYQLNVVKDLNSFLRILGQDFTDDKMRRLVLNVMCGKWERLSGETDPEYQRQQIAEMLGLLYSIKASPKHLVPVLKEMYTEMELLQKLKQDKTPQTWIEPPKRATSIASIKVKQVVRCLMEDSKPLFRRLCVNGREINMDNLGNRSLSIREDFFLRILREIYRNYDPTMTEDTLKEQVAYMLNYEKASEEIKREASNVLPCLDILKPCANGAWMVAEMMIRNLYGINNSPLKSKSIQGIEFFITIDPSTKKFSVETQKWYGIYPRKLPDDPTSNSIDESTLLAKVLFSWTLSPWSYEEQMISRFKGVLDFKEVVITKGISAEYEHLIEHGLYSIDSTFKNIKSWEDRHVNPKIVRPLRTKQQGNFPLSIPKYL